MILTVLLGLILVAVTAAISYAISRLFWSSKHGQTNMSGRHGLPFGGRLSIYGPAFLGAALTGWAGSAFIPDTYLALACFASLIAGLIAAIVGVCHSPQSDNK